MITDSKYLDWPFLTPEHKAYAQALAQWVASVEQSIPPDDADAACRAWITVLAKGGWLDPCAPEQGVMDVRKICLSRETLSAHDGLADFSFAMQGLGSGPIALYGTGEQKRRYLLPVRRGEHIAAFALSESEAGTDVGAMTTIAADDGDRFVLNGEKMWISNAGIADHYVVFARSPGSTGTRGINAIIVEADTPGLEVSERIEVIAPHPLGRLRFDDCAVPTGNLVGRRGEGFKVAMATLDVFRPTVGAAALGFARRALREALAVTTSRNLFGAPLADMQLTRVRLADMAVEIDASALLVYRAAWAKDTGDDRITREASMAKLYATEAAQRIIDAAVQLHGARGVRKGEVVEKLYREIRALRIYEGASEIQQQVIAKDLLRAFHKSDGVT